jgi:hypothetical protein
MTKPYNGNCPEWHLGDESLVKPRRFLWWSCQVASEAFADDSIALLLLSPRAKTTRASCGVFAFGRPDAVRRWSGLGYPVTRASQNRERGRIPRARRLKKSGIVQCDGMAPGSTKHRANFGYDHGKAVLCSNIHQEAGYPHEIM